MLITVLGLSLALRLAGWKSVLTALTIAAGDVSPAVLDLALVALGPVIEGMFRDGGLGPDGVPSVVAVVVAAARNPATEGSSVEAVFMLKGIARRLAAAGPPRVCPDGVASFFWKLKFWL